jgi:uncharacterized membrane protein
MADKELTPGQEIAQDLRATAHTGFWGRVRNYFLTGLIAVGPVAITAWLIWSFVTWVDGFIRPIIPPDYRPDTYLPVQVPGTGLIIAIVVVTLLGFLTANLVGRTLVGWGEGLLNRMPIVRPIYRTAKQIFETLFSKSGSSFRKVALVEFPAKGMWSLVFISQSPPVGIADRLPERDSDYVSVFLPCTPNPTTGFFFYVQRKELIDVDISVENAMTVLISAGMVQPEETQKKFAAMAATARAAQVARPETEPAK